MSPHRSGGKYAGSHTTIIDAAEDFVDTASKYSEVSKISLGEIKVIGRGMRNIKLLDIDSGFKCVVRGNTTRQYIFIYTNDSEVTKTKLLEFIKGN